MHPPGRYITAHTVLRRSIVIEVGCGEWIASMLSLAFLSAVILSRGNGGSFGEWSQILDKATLSNAFLACSMLSTAPTEICEEKRIPRDFRRETAPA